MNTTVDHTTTSSSGGQAHTSTLLAITSAAAVASAVGAVVGYMLGSSAHGQPRELDATEHLLSGGNRARILAALERDKNRQFVAHDLL